MYPFIEDHLFEDYKRLYKCLDKLETGLGGKRIFNECSRRQYWPKRGVYFIFEPGEIRDNNTDRIVYVGTHWSTSPKTTIWDRLSKHRGTLKDGSGRHDSSTLRHHVGDALQVMHPDLYIETWGHRLRDKETITKQIPLEIKVSDHVRNMSVLVLSIPDDALSVKNRHYIEEKTIVLISKIVVNYKVDEPSDRWLGKHILYQEHGLWNKQLVSGQYDKKFIERFDHYVDNTIEEFMNYQKMN